MSSREQTGAAPLAHTVTMNFGTSLKTRLQRGGYSLISESVTRDGRIAVRLRAHATRETMQMFLSDAIELSRGATQPDVILHRNRNVAFRS